MSDRPDVELRVPAETAYVAVLRTTTASLAARLDFTLDDIEDLRIAVGEACAMVLPQARVGTDLHVTYTLGTRDVVVSVVAETDAPVDLDRGGFAWQVLTALTASVETELTADSISITLAMASELTGMSS